MSDDVTSSKTISECISTIGVDMEALQGCINIQEEFFTIKKTYFKTILQCHPDKGGDAAIFRTVQTAFEVLRELFDSDRVVSFYSISFESVSESYNHAWQDFDNMATPSYKYYEEAASEPIPQQRMECAKSDRSTCKQKSTARTCGAKIPKGDVRIGSWHQETGTYFWWMHLACWRVPNRVWMGFPTPGTEDFMNKVKFGKALASMNNVVLCGFSELPKDKQEQVLEHVMNKDNWARARKIKPLQPTASGVHSLKNPENEENLAKQLPGAAQIIPSSNSATLERFVIPIPGKDGVISESLSGKTIVLTGTFPELGGGSGLSLGKAKLKAMIESFGGKVTGSVSGKTNILVVGKDPGFSKVSSARSKQQCTLLSLHALTKVIQGHLLEDVAKPMTIESFSPGYGGNGLADKVPSEALAIAAGFEEITHQGSSSGNDRKRAKEEEGGSKPSTKRSRNAPHDVVKTTIMKKTTVIANVAITTKPRNKAARKKKVVRKGNNETFSVTCDGCGVDCTSHSYFVASYNVSGDKDFCEKCGRGKGGIRQSYGNTFALAM